MSINPKCDMCQKELYDYGAILLSPPDNKSRVDKFHICKDCYKKIQKELKLNQ
jgi:hypothetical protein